MIKSLCVYCGANPGADPEFANAAREVGRYLGSRGCRLVYGGGQVGLMGIVADSTLDAGGSVTGIIPDFLHEAEVAHPGVDDLHVVSSMHERKQMMADEAEAFLAMPGGIGTMEELFEAWTWSQLGRHEKPVGLLNVGGYYDKLLGFLDTMAANGFLQDKHRAMLIDDVAIEPLMERINAYEHPGAIQSMDREQT